MSAMRSGNHEHDRGKPEVSLSQRNQLSAHSVVEGESFTLKVCGGNEAMQVRFDSDRGPFSITLVRMMET